MPWSASLTERPPGDPGEMPSLTLAHQLFWSADLDRARAHLAQLLARLADRQEPLLEADATRLSRATSSGGQGTGREADRHAAAYRELLDQLGQAYPFAVLQAALIAAHCGRIDEARTWALEGVARGKEEGTRITVASLSGVLGFVELSLQNHDAALGYLRTAHELRNDFLLEPGMRLELGDTVGGADRVRRARRGRRDPRRLGGPRTSARPCGRARDPRTLSRAALAARGDLDGAFASLEHALADHERSGVPFEHARTLLVLGRTQRRAKRRADARATLTDALQRFETLGAPLWVEQARDELARIGGRAPSDGALTEAETRIAALVAEGHTNREVAAALFLTEHSVETALTRVYRKLGVRSRAELTRRLTREG